MRESETGFGRTLDGPCLDRKEKRISRDQYGQEVKETKMKESRRKKMLVRNLLA